MGDGQGEMVVAEGVVTAEEARKLFGEGEHHRAWDLALDRALENASGLGRLGTYGINIHYGARIEVTNPGQIQSYHATFSPSP
jgi:hypothetical protein